MNKNTIRTGQKELMSEDLVPVVKKRRKGGGRKKFQSIMMQS